MPKLRSLALAVAIVAFVASLPGAASAQDAKVAVAMTKDITYAVRGAEELKLDIIRPATGDGPFPAVVCIHGGAWRGGKRGDMHSIMRSLASRGYIAVSPQYRLCPKEIFPAQVHDVKEAMRWVRSHAAEQKIDPERIAALGASAGAHLALMLGVTDPNDGLEGLAEGAKDAPSTRVQAVVNIFGPTELGADDIPEISKPLVKDFLGGTPAEKPDLTAKASPITFLTKDDPPILTFQGTLDPLVPHTQALKLGEKMTAMKVPGRVELLIGEGHGWRGAEMERTLNQTVLFLDSHLKAKKPAKQP